MYKECDIWNAIQINSMGDKVLFYLVEEIQYSSIFDYRGIVKFSKRSEASLVSTNSNFFFRGFSFIFIIGFFFVWWQGRDFDISGINVRFIVHDRNIFWNSLFDRGIMSEMYLTSKIFKVYFQFVSFGPAKFIVFFWVIFYFNGMIFFHWEFVNDFSIAYWLLSMMNME